MESPTYLAGKTWIQEVKDDIEDFIYDNEKGYYDEYADEYRYKYFSKKTMGEYRKALKLLKKVEVYIDCIYGLQEGDEYFFCVTEDQKLFHKRLKEMRAGRIDAIVLEETPPCVRGCAEQLNLS